MLGCLVLGVLAVCLWPEGPPPPASRPVLVAPDAAGPFSFAILSDRTGGAVPGKWAEAVEHVNRLEPDFVMSVGDFIEGYTSDEADLRRQWEEVDAITRRLKARFFYCPGNHDVDGDEARRVYTELHGLNGRTYYSFDFCGCHFVIVDTGRLPKRCEAELAAPQMAWLAGDLAAARHARRVFVFSHFPLHAEPSWKQLRAMIDPAKTTMFGGHWHALSHTVADGVDSIVLSASAAHRPNANPKEGKFNAVAHVVVRDGEPTITIVPLEADKAQYRTVIGKAPAAAAPSAVNTLAPPKPTDSDPWAF